MSYLDPVLNVFIFLVFLKECLQRHGHVSFCIVLLHFHFQMRSLWNRAFVLSLFVPGLNYKKPNVVKQPLQTSALKKQPVFLLLQLFTCHCAGKFRLIPSLPFLILERDGPFLSPVSDVPLLQDSLYHKTGLVTFPSRLHNLRNLPIGF